MSSTAPRAFLSARPRSTRARSLAPALLLALTAPVLAGCADNGRAEPAPESTSEAPATPTAEPSVGTGEYPRYVALGDSYTAAPLVPETDPSDGCLRSSGNYPSLVAEAFEGTALADVSCSGADTTSLIGVQRTFDGAAQPAQLDAVTEDTSLVTLSIGGNDFGLFSALVGGCAQLAQTDPDGSPCTDVGVGESTEVLAKIEQRVASVVEGIRDRAPDARILVVGYPQIVPQGDESCDALPLAAGTCPSPAPSTRDSPTRSPRARAARRPSTSTSTPSPRATTSAATTRGSPAATPSRARRWPSTPSPPSNRPWPRRSCASCAADPRRREVTHARPTRHSRTPERSLAHGWGLLVLQPADQPVQQVRETVAVLLAADHRDVGERRVLAGLGDVLLHRHPAVALGDVGRDQRVEGA